MSGTPGFRECCGPCITRQRALLGFRRGHGDRLEEVIFKARIKGIYGREMFEDWYKMSAMLAERLDVTPIITHRLRSRITAKASRS